MSVGLALLTMLALEVYIDRQTYFNAIWGLALLTMLAINRQIYFNDVCGVGIAYNASIGGIHMYIDKYISMMPVELALLTMIALEVYIDRQIYFNDVCGVYIAYNASIGGIYRQIDLHHRKRTVRQLILQTRKGQTDRQTLDKRQTD